MYFKAGHWVQSIGLKCGTFIRTEGKFKRPPWNKAFHGGQGGSQQEQICPRESFVSGIKMGFTRDGAEWKYLDYIELTCTPVAAGQAT